MTLSRAAQAERTRQAVLDTARTLFSEHGFDATSLQQIADTMGVTKANVYYYFPTKLDIIEEILAGAVDELGAMLDVAETIRGKRARIEFMVDSFVNQVVVAHRTIGPMNRADPIVRRHPAISNKLDQLAKRGLHLAFGEHPTLDQRAAYWMINDLAPVTRHLGDVSDSQLRLTLKQLCLRVLRV